MQLSKRLLEIANFVPKNSIVVDIGTDHGYIPAYLIEKKTAKKVIASDISRESLAKGKEYIKNLPVKNNIEMRVGDGFDILKPFEADTAIIAGMGGALIADIIDKRKEVSQSITNFILQPMVASDRLRRYLYKNNFKIINEKLIREGKHFYEIIYARQGKDYIEKEIYFEIGKMLIDNKDPLLEDFLNYKIKKAEGILSKIKTDTLNSIKRREMLTRKIKAYQEVLGIVKG